MLEIIDLREWNEVVGLSAGSGRSEKIWLESPGKEIGLLKFPKTTETTEHISEVLAYLIAKVLNLEAARYDLAEYNGRMGSVSYLFTKSAQELSEGTDLFLGRFPDYDQERLVLTDSSEHYSLDHIMDALDYINNLVMEDQKDYGERIAIPAFKRDLLKMLVFDALIGNSDRHQSNWGILKTADKEKGKTYINSFSPIYDNGSALCCYVKEEEVSAYFSDRHRMNALIDSRSKSLVRIDKNSNRKPTHREVMRHLKKSKHSGFLDRDFVAKLLCKGTEREIIKLLDDFPSKVLTHERKQLIRCFLLGKLEMLRQELTGD